MGASPSWMPRKRLWVSLAVALLAGVAVGFGASAARLIHVDRPVGQPYPFNHQRHSGAGCTTCHHGVRKQAHAGLPSLEACQECHATPPGRPGAKELAAWKAAEHGDAPGFNRLYQVPDHVFFSHRRHVSLGGLDCRTCHGDIGSSTEPPRLPVSTILMAKCLDCHEDAGVTTDCTSCHR